MEIALSETIDNIMEVLEIVLETTNVEKVNHVKIKTKQERPTKVKVSCPKQKRGRGRPRKEV